MSPGIAHLKEHKFFTMFVMVQNVKPNQTEEHKRTSVLQLRVALRKPISICLQMADPPNKNFVYQIFKTKQLISVCQYSNAIFVYLEMNRKYRSSNIGGIIFNY